MRAPAPAAPIPSAAAWGWLALVTASEVLKDANCLQPWWNWCLSAEGRMLAAERAAAAWTEPPLPGQVTYEQAKGFAQSWLRGQPHKAAIASTMFKDRISPLQS